MKRMPVWDVCQYHLGSRKEKLSRHNIGGTKNKKMKSFSFVFHLFRLNAGEQIQVYKWRELLYRGNGNCVNASRSEREEDKKVHTNKTEDEKKEKLAHSLSEKNAMYSKQARWKKKMWWRNRTRVVRKKIQIGTVSSQCEKKSN